MEEKERRTPSPSHVPLARTNEPEKKKKRRFLRGVAHVTASIYGTYSKGT